MKTNIVMMAVAAAMLPALAMAADLTGIWVRDAKSDPRPDTMYWLTRGGESAGAFSLQGFTLTVKQDATNLVVTNPNLKFRSVALDSRPHVVPTDTLIQQATVVAVNAPDAVTITTTQPFGGMPGNAVLTTKETWAVSADGAQLTVTTTRQLPARIESDRQVFNRRS